MVLNYKIVESDVNKTVKEIIYVRLNLSSRLIRKLKMCGNITVNQNPVNINYIPSLGSVVQVDLEVVESDEIVPQPGQLDILYEDDAFLAVNKPADLVVHPCSYHPDNTLANYVKYYLNNSKKIRPINRIDRNTTGIVLFAKNEYIQESFKNLQVKPQKDYIAIVYGTFDKKNGTISLPIARNPNSLIEREVNFESGKEAVTKYEVLAEKNIENVGYISIVKLSLETGRTHQIRVHMSYLGHNLLGDDLYGSGEKDTIMREFYEDFSMNRQALHAYRLCFEHPITRKNIEIIAPLPDDMRKIVK